MRYAKIKISSDEDVQRIALSIHDCEIRLFCGKSL